MSPSFDSVHFTINPRDVDRRQHITLVLRNTFWPFDVHRRIARECITQCWDATWTSWHMIPETAKGIWYEEFQKRLDIYQRPLIDDLVHLWNDGVDTYDANRKQSFTLRATLMWTVSDFPAYAMLSGWSTQGKLGCPYYMEDTKQFVLKNGRKVSYFGCHR
ncbi:hypothetical protein QQ045_005089 [Rhodiola kirilowii]